MKVETNLSRNLHRITKERGWNQKDVADQMGLSYTTVNSWYLGNNAPRANTLAKLANILCVSVSDLLADYNSTIPNKQNVVKTPVASTDNPAKPSILPKYDDEEGDNGTLLGKSKEFWEIMQAVDNMNQNEQKKVLGMIRIMNQN